MRLPQVRGSFIVYRSISPPRLTHLNPCPSKPHLILTQFSPRLTRLTPTADLLSQNYACFSGNFNGFRVSAAGVN